MISYLLLMERTVEFNNTTFISSRYPPTPPKVHFRSLHKSEDLSTLANQSMKISRVTERFGRMMGKQWRHKSADCRRPWNTLTFFTYNIIIFLWCVFSNTLNQFVALMIKYIVMGLRGFFLLAAKIWSFICYCFKRQARAVSY